MLKHFVPKFRPDLSARLKDIAVKQVPAKLKPIVGKHKRFSIRHGRRHGFLDGGTEVRANMNDKAPEHWKKCYCYLSSAV